MNLEDYFYYFNLFAVGVKIGSSVILSIKMLQDFIITIIIIIIIKCSNLF
jgi:hypothetical protein